MPVTFLLKRGGGKTPFLQRLVRFAPQMARLSFVLLLVLAAVLKIAQLHDAAAPLDSIAAAFVTWEIALAVWLASGSNLPLATIAGRATFGVFAGVALMRRNRPVDGAGVILVALASTAFGILALR